MLVPAAAGVYLVAVLGLSCCSWISASSVRSPPLHPDALSHPSFASFTLLPRRSPTTPFLLQRRSNVTLPSSSSAPSWDDRFYLDFISHGRNITLSLRPSQHLIHPDGIHSLHESTNTDGIKTTTRSRIPRHHFKVYEGFVLDQHVDREHWTNEEIAGVDRPDKLVNWARIVLVTSDDKNDDEDESLAEGLRFQGSYATDSDIYTIHSTANYLRTRQLLDPDPPIIRKRSSLPLQHRHPPMVIVREGHTLSPQQHTAALYKRGLPIPDSLSTAAAPSSKKSCGHDDLLPFNTFHVDPNPNANNVSPNVYDGPPSLGDLFNAHRRRMKRQDALGGGPVSDNFINSIGSTAGCPTSRKVVFIGVAADCTYVNHYGSADQARTQILTDFNSASSLYSSSFNVSLGIIHLNVQSGECPTTAAQVDPENPWNVGCPEGGGPGLEMNDRLSALSEWRGKHQDDGAGLWHLVTNCSTGAEVGVAWLSQLCKTSAQSSGNHWTSGTGVTAITTSTWSVIAHEIGHNFGSIHDCVQGCTLADANPSCCPLSRTSCDTSTAYIMSPVSSQPANRFSPCTIGNVCTALGSTLNTTCLQTPGTVGNPMLISLQSCGNGILEAGEDCDPGSKNSASDPCCNAATCKFVPNAVCSPMSSTCCTNMCQIAAKGQVCRPSEDSRCDIAETCSGSSTTCPVDAFIADGTSCGSNGLACASGLCTSRDLQCAEAGVSLRIKAACPLFASPGCSVTCASPNNSSTCIILDQVFRNGSPCGYAGVCQSNICISGAPFDVVRSWYLANLAISIPVTIGAAILLFIILLALVRCCRNRRSNTGIQKVKAAAASAGYIDSSSRGRQQMQQQSSLQYPQQVHAVLPPYQQQMAFYNEHQRSAMDHSPRSENGSSTNSSTTLTRAHSAHRW